MNPSAAEIRAARQAAGQHQGEAAATVYVGLRTWNRWEAGDAAMHPAIWELYLIKTRPLISGSARADGSDAGR